MNAADKVARARSVLVMQQPFFGCLALHLELAERSDIETMATDGRHLFYNAAFVHSLSEPELVGTIAHEVMHCAMGHHCRIRGRDLSRFNEAADYAINPGLIAAGFQLPAGILNKREFDGLAAEEIYSILTRQEADKAKKEQGQQGQVGQQGGQPGQGQPSQGGQQGQPAPGNGGQGQPGNGQPAPGNGSAPGQPSGQPGNAPGQPAPGQPSGKPGNSGHGIGGILPAADMASPADAAAEADRWQVLARQAVNIAKAHNAGTIPGYLERLVSEIAAPLVDFRELLADWIDSRVVSDYSFMRPNRRHMHAGLYLPGSVIDGLGHVVFAVDTSGSITDEDVSRQAAAVMAALESGKIERVTVLMADTAVRAVYEFQRGDDFKAPAVGGGGTAFADTFEWIEREASDATAVVYLTDLEVTRFGDDPGIPVLWATHGDSRKFDGLASRVPFGEPVYIGRL